MRTALLIVGTCFGCANGQSDNHTIPVGQNDLGISRVELATTVNDGDRVLAIRGVDDQDHVIATATLRTGMVQFSPEPGVVEEGWSMGTEFHVTVGNDHLDDVSPDLEPHVVQAFATPRVASFLRLDPVARGFEDEAGLRFSQPDTGEVPFFGAQPCNYPLVWPADKGAPASCCMASASPTSQEWFDSSTGILGTRTYATSPCRTSTFGSNCSGAGCYYGPCRGHSTQINDYGVVFVPASSPYQCGWDDLRGNYDPEVAGGNTNYGDFGPYSATCTCTGCTNGSPTPAGCSW